MPNLPISPTVSSSSRHRFDFLRRQWFAVAMVTWSLVACPIARATNVVFSVGNGSGSGNQNFNINNPVTYNFGVTVAGGTQNLQAVQFQFTVSRGQQVTAPVVFSIYDNLGATGTVIAQPQSVASGNFTNSGFGTTITLLTEPVPLAPGYYSIRMTTASSGSGADNYQWKDGLLRLTDSNGTDISRFFYIEDSNATGTAGTTLNSTTGVLAQPVLASQSVNFGNFRLGTTLSQNVQLTNANLATGNNYSEALAGSANTTGAATVSGVPLAGAPLNHGQATNLTVGLGSGTAGPVSGNVNLSFTSVQGSSVSPGPFNTAVGTPTIAVSGTGYREATAGFDTTEVSLGRFHVGATDVTGTFTVSNTQVAGQYSEGLAAAATGTSGGASVVTGLPSVASPLAAGGQSTVTVNLASIANVGMSNGGTVTLGLQTSGAGTSGLAAASIGSQMINVSAQGYSGQSIWSHNSGGTWSSFDNWDVPGGLPGVDGTLSVLDTATFAGASTTNATVNLDGASPTLASLTFSNPDASYTVARGSGGNLVIGTAAATGSIAATAGSHVISAPLVLGRATTVTTDTGAVLTVSGALTGSDPLAKLGGGELAITGSGSLSGATTVGGGTLRVNGSLASSGVTVQSGATLAGSGTVGSLVIQSGGTLAPGNSPGVISVNGDAIWESGGNYNWQIHDAAGTAGVGWDLTAITGNLDLTSLSMMDPFNINLWSLAEIDVDVNGDILNFNPSQAYSWTIAEVAHGSAILGFSPDLFNLNLVATNGTSGFTNSLGGGTFSIEQDGAALNIVFMPVPEPGWAVLVLAGAGFALAAKRRRSWFCRVPSD